MSITHITHLQFEFNDVVGLKKASMVFFR